MNNVHHTGEHHAYRYRHHRISNPLITSPARPHLRSGNHRVHEGFTPPLRDAVCGKIISHKPPPPAFRRHRPTSVTRQQTQPQPPRASSALPDRHHRQQISATRVHRNQFSPLGLRDLPPPALAPPRSASHRSHANAPHRRTFTPGTQDAETTKLLHIYRTSQQINPTLTPHPPIAKPCPP